MLIGHGAACVGDGAKPAEVGGLLAKRGEGLARAELQIVVRCEGAFPALPVHAVAVGKEAAMMETTVAI